MTEKDQRTTYLVMDVSSARLQLEEQITKELTLVNSLPNGDQSTLAAAKFRFQNWNEFNTLLLRRMFSTEELSKEYSSHPKAVIGFGTQSLYEQMQDFIQDVGEKVRRLQSLTDRLQFYVPAGTAPLTKNPVHRSTIAAFTSWPGLSLASGMVAVVIVILLWKIPSLEWRLWIAFLLAVFFSVAGYVRGLDPNYFYRKMLSYSIPAGFAINGVGFASEAQYAGSIGDGSLHWNGAASGTFNVAGALVVIALASADTVQQSRRTR